MILKTSLLVESISQLFEVYPRFFPKFSFNICQDRTYQAIVVAQETFSLPCVASTLAQFRKIGLVLTSQSTHRYADRFIIACFRREGQYALE